MENVAYESKKYTYEDLEKMEQDDNQRYEIINGDLFVMQSPHGRHQLILGELFGQIREFLKGKKCKTFIAPFDVVLSKSKKKNEIYNVIQPDIFVLCDLNKYDGSKVFGAPDLVIEIVSLGTKTNDRLRKFNLYQHYGLREYWIVDLIENSISPYILNEKGIFELPHMYELTESIKVKILPGLTISLKDFINENANLLKEDEAEYEVQG